MSKPGRLYVFEGPPGSGKTTLAKALAERGQSAGESWLYYAFSKPEPGTLSALVYDLHHGRCSELVPQPLHQSVLQTLHVAAHLDGIQRVLLPALRSGTTVVLDCFWWSMKVNALKNGVALSMIDALVQAEKVAWQEFNQPAIVFYVKTTESLRLDIPEAQRRLMIAQFDGYLDAMTRQFPRVVKINNDRKKIDQALQEIVDQIEAGSRSRA